VLYIGNFRDKQQINFNFKNMTNLLEIYMNNYRRMKYESVLLRCFISKDVIYLLHLRE